MIQLVDDWHRFYKWFSTWLLASNGMFIVAYEQFPTIRAYIPDKWAHIIVGVLLIFTFLGRVIKQAP